MDTSELPQLLRFAAALIFVLALMGGLSLILRRLNHMHPSITPRKKRLKIVESLPVDGRRRLLLIRRDGVEHLLILGVNDETVIETGIESPQDGGIETQAAVTDATTTA